MQKKIIALAIAGLASTAAFAQSNVTIYGVADATFDSIKTTGSVEPRHNRISTNSSLIGFKGSEALGNGLTAVFQFEGSVGFDGGSAFGGANRDSYVGVAGGFGTIVAGNLTGPTRAFGAAVDVNAGATGIAANSGIIGKFGGFLQGVTTTALGDPTANNNIGRSATASGPFDTRWKNTIAYISPTMAGFTVIGAYVANENKTNSINTYGYDVGVKYAAGPVLVGLSYNRAMFNNDGAIAALRAPVNTMTDIVAADLRLVASFDAGVVKINGLAERVKVSATGFSETQNVYGLGAIVPVGKGKVTGQYYVAREVSGIDDTGAKLWSVGYEHSLSKRTILKANYARLSNDSASNLQFGVNSNATNTGETASGFQVGVRHSF
jgi:predicted porin